MIKLLVVLLMLSGTAMANKVSKDPTIILEGVITGRSLAPLSEYLDTVIATPVVIKQLNIIISSPGGSVTAGYMFINRLKAVQARGTNVSCYVADVAASMAFQILLQCDDRHALDTSWLLWHRARVNLGQGAITGPELHALGVQLKQLDQNIFEDVMLEMVPEVTPQYVRFHFERETLHTGRDISSSAPSFMTVNQAIPGLMEALNNKQLPRSASGGFFGFRRNELVYISDKLVGN